MPYDIRTQDFAAPFTATVSSSGIGPWLPGPSYTIGGPVSSAALSNGGISFAGCGAKAIWNSKTCMCKAWVRSLARKTTPHTLFHLLTADTSGLTSGNLCVQHVRWHVAMHSYRYTRYSMLESPCLQTRLSCDVCLYAAACRRPAIHRSHVALLMASCNLLATSAGMYVLEACCAVTACFPAC